MNKINKLVQSTFPQIKDEWMKDDFQKKLKKIFKKKREVKPEDENCPKKHTSYIRYCIAERPNTKKMYPNLAAKEITTQLGKQWNQAKIEKPEELARLFGFQPSTEKTVKNQNNEDKPKSSPKKTPNMSPKSPKKKTPVKKTKTKKSN